MSTSPLFKFLKFLCVANLTIALFYSCSKDEEVLEDSEFSLISETDARDAVLSGEDYLSSLDLDAMGFETRTAIFRPMNNLEKTSGQNLKAKSSLTGTDKGRLEFDLSGIDAIGGTIEDAKFRFTADGNDADADISIFKTVQTDSAKVSSTEALETQADATALLGRLKGSLKAGSTEEIALEKSQLSPERISLIVPPGIGGNQFSVSDSNEEDKGPALEISYLVRKGAKNLSSEALNDKTSVSSVSNTGTNKGKPVATYAKASSANQPPDSRPSASTVRGAAPLKVQFGKGRSSDDKGIASYKWYFMDGTTSNEENPVHTFTEPGVYKVILSLHDAEGLENGRIIIITVTSSDSAANLPPDSRPSASVVSGAAPLRVQFGKGSSSDDKGIVSYKWYFMDGTTSTETNPTHTFTKPGTYKVILSVHDEEGLENGRIIIITVTGGANQPPDSRPSASVVSGNAPLKVQFGKGSSSDDKGIASYKWYFRDGTTSSEPNPSHTFTQPGVYKVILSITDEEGLENGRIIIITVTGTGSGGDNDGGNDESQDGDDDNSASGSGGGSSGSGGGSGDTASGGSNDNPSNGVKASTFGYNSGDATQALKAAINSSHSTIIVDRQSSDWVVGPLYLNRIRNKKIIFESGVVLRAKRGAFRPSNRLFQLVNSENVEVQGYGATFVMNKSEYSGQQNHAFAIVNSSNITVKGLTLTGAGGDGLYVSRHYDGEYCRNIVIDGVTSTKNQRQGLTVVSVDGLQVKNSTFSETSGESPSSGVDFEPESTRDRLNNISVTNCTFKDNHGPGIMFAVNKLNGSTMPLDATFTNIRVSNNALNDPRSRDTEIDLGMSSGYVNNPVKGTVTFNGLTVENSRHSAIWTKKTLEAYHVNLKNTIIRNVSKSSSKAAIHIGLLGYGSHSNANMGGFTFENVLIDYDGADPSVRLHGPSHNNWRLANMRGQIRVRSPRDGTRFVDNTDKLQRSQSSSSVNLSIVED